MKNPYLFIAIFFLAVCMLTSGCINQDLGSLSDNGPVKSPATPTPVSDEKTSEGKSPPEPIQQRVMTPDTPASVQLKKFIEETFPKVTAAYVDIQESSRALDAIGIQNKALEMEILVQDLTEEYNLDQSLPEKNVFPGLTSREEVIFNKYIGFIRDLGEYASYLKEAVYWKNLNSDAASLGNYRRNQDLADQYGKKVITSIQSLHEYSKEGGFMYLDDKYVQKYSFNT